MAHVSNKELNQASREFKKSSGSEEFEKYFKKKTLMYKIYQFLWVNFGWVWAFRRMVKMGEE